MSVIDYSDPDSFASRLRRKRIRFLVSQLAEIVTQERKVSLSICDVGGTATYWKSFPFSEFDQVSFQIDLYNIEYPGYDIAETGGANVTFRKLIGDARNLEQVADDSYDIAHSNSVIEHVGGFDGASMMASAMRRVARHYFVQTPNFWFPIEPHVLIPLYLLFPRPIRWRMLERLKGLSFADAIRRDASIWLLNRRMLAHLFPGSEILTERFLGLPKSFLVRSRLEQQ